VQHEKRLSCALQLGRRHDPYRASIRSDIADAGHAPSRVALRNDAAMAQSACNGRVSCPSAVLSLAEGSAKRLLLWSSAHKLHSGAMRSGSEMIVREACRLSNDKKRTCPAKIVLPLKNDIHVVSMSRHPVAICAVEG
jgi:hypothetical protein